MRAAGHEPGVPHCPIRGPRVSLAVPIRDYPPDLTNHASAADSCVEPPNRYFAPARSHSYQDEREEREKNVVGSQGIDFDLRHDFVAGIAVFEVVEAQSPGDRETAAVGVDTTAPPHPRFARA